MTNEAQIDAIRKATLENLIELGAKSRLHVSMSVEMCSHMMTMLIGDDDPMQELLVDAVMLIVTQRRELEQVRAGDRETAVAA